MDAHELPELLKRKTMSSNSSAKSSENGSTLKTNLDITPLSGYVQAQPLRQVIPHIENVMPSGVPFLTRIEVAVRIDKSGHVSEAHTISRRSILTNACIIAARQWRFNPAKVNGELIESEYVIVFVFRPRVPW